MPVFEVAMTREGLAHYEYERFPSDDRYGLLDGLTSSIALLATVDFAREDLVEFARWLVGNAAAAAAEDAGCAKLIS